MSEARALTNLIGNGVATVIVAKWENSLDKTQYNKAITEGMDFEKAMQEKHASEV